MIKNSISTQVDPRVERQCCGFVADQKTVTIWTCVQVYMCFFSFCARTTDNVLVNNRLRFARLWLANAGTTPVQYCRCIRSTPKSATVPVFTSNNLWRQINTMGESHQFYQADPHLLMSPLERRKNKGDNATAPIARSTASPFRLHQGSRDF